ncbi:hypothetical protein K504DRAFT_458955 [Pleomassaria siparia CBS 279.74]|uniref:Uncharacterized protein n=1 Tax=Pleomassaria siparia CBS 279.74 TaxID=1314801 RepID=A0A6G1K108_9PLEO|nr:hypothetical protein K504DRAFT_458955 [Pleomassaria siparia CBS 279.74]
MSVTRQVFRGTKCVVRCDTLPLLSAADWHGHGRCDLLVTSRATTRNAAFHNDYTPITIGAGQKVVLGSKCPQAWLPGPTDPAMRFGNLDGDNKADCLFTHSDGRTIGRLNTATGLTALNRKWRCWGC